MNDIVLNSDGSLKIKGNDLVIGDCDGQNINDILNSNKGDYKMNPQIGVNAVSFANGATSPANIKAQVKLQLQLDGFNVSDVMVKTEANGTINIIPYASR